MKLNYASFKERFIKSFEYDPYFEFEEEDLNEYYSDFRVAGKEYRMGDDDIDSFYYWLKLTFSYENKHEFWLKPIGPVQGPISMDKVLNDYQYHSVRKFWSRMFYLREQHISKEMKDSKCGPVQAAINLYLPDPSKHGYGLILAAGYEMLLNETRGAVKQSIDQSVQAVSGLSRLGEDLKTD